MKEIYLDTIRLMERLHRQFLEVVKSELDRLGIEDINNVQSLILFNIGRDEMTVGELTNRGYYLGSNVSYNVRKMVENGYLAQERSAHDRRSIRVKLTQKGLDLCNAIDAMFDRQLVGFKELGTREQFQQAGEVFHRVERYWVELFDYGMRSSGYRE